MTSADLYPWLVAAHVTAVVFFVGGLLAQTRLLALIRDEPKAQQDAMLAILLRLDRGVTVPALALAWILGLTLALTAGWFASGWLIAKLGLVVALSALHGIQSGRIRRFLQSNDPRPAIAGSGPFIVLAMAAIAILAVVKPF